MGDEAALKRRGLYLCYETLPRPPQSLQNHRQQIMEDNMAERSEGSQQAFQRVPEDDADTVGADVSPLLAPFPAKVAARA